jgi:hypothetical protein
MKKVKNEKMKWLSRYFWYGLGLILIIYLIYDWENFLKGLLGANP